MIPTRLAAVANSKGLIHDWLFGSGAVTATASDMLGTVQKQQTIFPILLLNEGLASFDPFVPQPTCQSPCLLTMVNSEAFVGLQTMPHTRFWGEALFPLLFL